MDQSTIHVQNLIGGILTPQQDIHQKAQDEYFRLQEANPSQLFLSLGLILQHSQEHTARLFAAVILRQQSLPSKTLMDSIDPAVIAQLKAIAMHLFQTEPNAQMRRKVIEFAAVFASRLFQKHTATTNPADAWPEILQLTCQGAGLADQPAIQASCFDMIAQIAEYCVNVFNGQDKMMVQLLSAALQQTTPIDVAIAAATAALFLITSYRFLYDTETQPHLPINQPLVEALQATIDAYSNAIPLVCAVFARALTEQRENKLGQFLGALDQTINLHPGAFTSSFGSLVDLIISIARHEELEPSFRERCLGLLIRFGSSPGGRALCRKNPRYQSSLLTLGFEFLSDIDYTQQWAADPLYITKDEGDFPNFHLGLFIIRSLPNTMGVKTFMTPMLQDLFKRAGDTSNWKQPHAVFNILMLLAEDHMKSIPKPAFVTIRQIMVALSNPKLASKANPRVTVACLQAIAAFATKLGQKTAQELLENVLTMVPANIEQLNTIPGTMVYYASRALSVLAAALSPENLKPFIPRLLPAISSCLSHSLNSITNSALAATSSLALQIGPDFADYAATIVPALLNLGNQCNVEIQQILSTGAHKSNPEAETKLDLKHKTRNKSMETLSYIAEALGHDCFLPYSTQVIGFVAQSQELEPRFPNPTMQYILDAFTRLADCLQQDFGQYLSTILPGILQAAAATDFHYRFDLDGDQNMSAQDQALAEDLRQRGFISQVISLHGRGSQRVVINTTVIQDKIQALEILGNFALSLKESFGPFLRQTANVLLPECASIQNPRIRWSSTSTVPALIECLYHQPGVKTEDVLNFFVECINAFDLPKWVSRELPEGLAHLILSTTACLDAVHNAGVSAIPTETLQIIAQTFTEGWNLCIERRLSIEQEVLTGDEEQMELKAESFQIENEALDALVALNTELLSTNRDQYFPFFVQKVEPLFAAGIGPQNEVNINGKQIKRDPYLHACSLIGYADSIAKSGPHGVQFINKVFSIFMTDALDAVDHELRRGAAYGISACHRALSMSEFAPHIDAAVDVLARSAMIKYEPAEGAEYDEDADESAIYAQDNALAGLSDIMTRYGCGFLTPTCVHSPQEQQNFATIEPFIRTHYMNQYMPVILENLPCFHDEEEAVRIHHNLAVWLQRCPQSVYGPDNGNIIHIIRIIAHMLDLNEEYEIATAEDLDLFKSVWRNLRSSLPPTAVQTLLKAIDKDYVGQLDFE